MSIVQKEFYTRSLAAVDVKGSGSAEFSVFGVAALAAAVFEFHIFQRGPRVKRNL
jgi:hypothetical protein